MSKINVNPTQVHDHLPHPVVSDWNIFKLLSFKRYINLNFDAKCRCPRTHINAIPEDWLWSRMTPSLRGEWGGQACSRRWSTMTSPGSCKKRINTLPNACFLHYLNRAILSDSLGCFVSFMPLAWAINEIMKKCSFYHYYQLYYPHSLPWSECQCRLASLLRFPDQ